MRLSRPVALTALALGLATFAAAAPALAAPASVDVVNRSFQASSVTVATGEAVTWNWKEGGHDVAFQSGPEKIAASPFNSAGASWSHTFTKAGTYSYICEAHPNMKGTVTVVDAASPGAGAPGSPSTGAGAAPAAAGGSAQPVTGSAGPVVAGAAGPDAAAPVLSALAFRRNALHMRLSEPATLTVRFARVGGAHTVATRRVHAHKGANTISLRRWMRPGRYRVSLVAVDAAGNASRPARMRLAVRR